MAGLLNSSPQDHPESDAHDPMAVDQGTVSDSDGTEPASEEEQAQYDAFVKSGLKLVYEGGQVRQGILDLLDEDPSDLISVLGDVAKDIQQATPAIRLGATAAIVVLEMVEQAGGDRPADDVIYHGGKEILEDLANLAEKAGIHDYSQEEINQAFLYGADLYREAGAQAGLVDMDALKAQFDDIVTADKQGELGAVLPALAKADVNHQQPADAAPTDEGADDGRVR